MVCDICLHKYKSDDHISVLVSESVADTSCDSELDLGPIYRS